jgi:hypothetical protein
MKLKQKMEFTLGDLIAAAYQVWGAGWAEKMVQSAVNARLAVFRVQPFILISSAKGRLV